MKKEDFGVYTFIDENGNVTQIKREDRRRILVYPDKPTLYEWNIIGVEDEVAMGINDLSDGVVLAEYSPIKKH